MNNDTVNPIPPSRETPAIFFQFIPAGVLGYVVLNWVLPEREK